MTKPAVIDTLGLKFDECMCDVCHALHDIEHPSEAPDWTELRRTGMWTGLAEGLADSLTKARKRERAFKAALTRVRELAVTGGAIGSELSDSLRVSNILAVVEKALEELR